MPAALTAATVKAAIRDSRAGKRWAKADGLMPGLQLRSQPTGARWTVRARLNDLQRRWDKRWRVGFFVYSVLRNFCVRWPKPTSAV